MTLRNVACAAAALVIALAPVHGASAHAAYKGSDPPDNGKVGSPPSRVTAEFTEPLAGGSYLQVTDPCGDRVDGDDVSISGYTMSVSMSGDVAGRYVVFYRAHSQLDPHVTQGEFDFSATSGGRCAGSEPDAATGSGSGGGGGGGGGSGGSGGGSASGDTTAAPSASTGSSGAGSSGSGGTRQSANNGSRGRNGGDPSTRRDHSGFQPKRATVPNIAPPEQREDAEKPSVWDGIRLEPFLTGLLLASIIGAAGGKIYAGIMGPRA